MKIIKCHIENFGKLTDFTYSFSDGLNEFCEENGWGKSTLAGFIKVMLYGFENEGKRDELENERKRYRPWQGGVYGGSLSFETNGKRYLAERTFGAKSSEDTFVLRNLDTNMECDDFSANLGEDIFKIDAKSFMRTIYISQNDCEAVVTDAIHAKMGNLVDATDDINNYDTVINGFKKTLNEMTPSRKTGSIYKLGERIAEKNNELRSRPEVDDSIRRISEYRSEQREKYDRLSEELKAISDKQQVLSGYMELAAKREEYERINNEYSERQSVFLAETGYFKQGIPEEQELDSAIEKNISLAAVEDSVGKYTLSESERNILNAGRIRFPEGVPESSEIEAAYELAEKLKELRTSQEKNSLSAQEREDYESGMALFGGNVPEESEIAEYIREWSIYQEKKSGIASKQSALYALWQMNIQNKDRKRRNGQKAAVIMLICGAVLLIAGVAYMVLASSGRLAGGIGAGIGAAVFIAGAIAFLTNKRGNNASEDFGRLPIEEEIEKDQLYIEEVQADINELFSGLGLQYSEASVPETLYDLKNKSADLKRLISKVRDIERSDRSREIEETAVKLNRFLGKYYGEDELGVDSYEAYIHRLCESANEYVRLEEKCKNLKDANELGERLKGELREFLIKYGFEESWELSGENGSDENNRNIENGMDGVKGSISGILSDIRSHLQSYIPAKTEYDRSLREKTAFEKENDIERLMTLQKPKDAEGLETLSSRAAEIREEMEQTHKNILDYDKQLDDLQEKLEELEELASEIETEKQQYEADKRKYELINKTREYMEKAKISFTAKYVAPMKSGFDKYYSMINGTVISERIPGEYYIDADSNVTVYEAGMQRESRFLSRGLKDLTGICMRMALIEAMYKDERPFVVFDDPFVNLDAARTDGGLKFLEEIAPGYQIIYFTCHPGRTRCQAKSAQQRTLRNGD